MGPREVLKRWSTDQLITGIETQDWVRVLRENNWRVSPTYLHRLAWISGWSLPSTLLGRVEDARFGRQLASQDISPSPIFVLGHWRSGTTHLHNLLGRAPGHTYPTVYQVVFPTSFLTTDPVLPQLTQRFMDDTRTYDNVRHGWYEAAEDEIALAKLTGMSPYIAFMFPDNAAKYERYLDFIEAPADDRERWSEAFRYFIKKIMLQTGGDRVVVKSCTHTARIRLLLELFPDARFVYIHRHPYEVFASTLHMRSHTDWENFFQLPEGDWEQSRRQQTLIIGQRMFERYAADRHLIPEGQLIEIAYSDLVGNELEHLENIYRTFELPDWERAEVVLRGYVEGLRGYKRNKLSLPERDRDAVYDHWRTAFETFGYDRHHAF